MCFNFSQVLFEVSFFYGDKVSASDNMTTLNYSIVSMEAFEIYAQNNELDVEKFIRSLDAHNYHMMNIVDYLVGNTDRHWGNWGVLVDNANNRPVCLHKLMDFNQAFHAYDQIDGANCQTVFGKQMTQKEAAVQAVKNIGFNQVKEVDKAIFTNLPQYYNMFLRRLEFLRKVNSEKRYDYE